MLQTWLRTAARLLLSPLARLTLRLMEDDDPWDPMDPRRISHLRTGPGVESGYDACWVGCSGNSRSLSRSGRGEGRSAGR